MPGGWLAVRGEFSATPWLLGAAVMCWVAGFDVLYACGIANDNTSLYSVDIQSGEVTQEVANAFDATGLPSAMYCSTNNLKSCWAR